MKIPFTALLLAGATMFSASAQDKFNSTSIAILDTYERIMADPTLDVANFKDLPFEISNVRSRAETRATVFVSLHPGATAANVEAEGFEIVTDLDNIVLANGTIDDIKALANLDFVKAISFSTKLTPMMDNTRKVTGGESIQSGTGLPQKYTGAGVIAGIMDTGMDPNHVNFLDENGNSRIARFWYFNGEGGSATEYTNETIGTFQSDDKNETHGTHTLGCMAGSWNGRGGGKVAYMTSLDKMDSSPLVNNPYYGMAPGTEIAAAGGQLYDANIIAAGKKIVDYANSVGKPIVLNYSLGSNAGPHDGSDPTGQAFDNLAKQGAIICVAAGNEGDSNISLIKDFTDSDTSVATFVNPGNGSAGYIDIWSGSSETFSLTVLIYDFEKKEEIYSYTIAPDGGSNSFRLGYGGVSNEAFSKTFTSNSYISLARSTNSGTNNRYSVSGIISLTTNSTLNSGYKNYALGLRITGKAGQRVDITNNKATFSSYNVSGFTNGSSDFSINNMACGPNVIAVGSWNARIQWPTFAGLLGYSGNPFQIGAVSSFSSYGVLNDGRILPEICAPGLQVISSISTYYYDNVMQNTSEANYISAEQTTPNKYTISPGRKNYYLAESGTSMASPVCAGAIALWLEANPNLTVTEVKDILKNTANNQNLIAANPMTRWGKGKLDALAGIKYVLSSEGISDVAADNRDNILFTPTGLNEWEVFVPGAKTVVGDIYNMSGVKVATESAEGNTLLISGDSLGKGIYVVSINGANAQRVTVR